MNELQPDGRESVRAVLFDLDGTLVDTESQIYEAWRSTFRDSGLELRLVDWQPNLGTRDAFDPRAHLERHLGRDCSDLARRTKDEIARRCRFLTPRPGVLNRVWEAKHLGLQLAVVSSSDTAWVEERIRGLGVRRQIDLLCCGDQVDRLKPAPDLYLLAARSLGVEPQQCLVFEDSPNGARAAVTAGMRCVVVPNDLTRGCEFPGVDLVLASLDEENVADILRRLAPNEGGRALGSGR